MRQHVNRHLRFFPRAEAMEPEFNRGDLRLAAEATLARDRGWFVPASVCERVSRVMTRLAE